MPKDLNYNTDIIKHHVRYYGWIKPFKTILNFVDAEVKKGRRVEKCKYLTFCAIQAIDVFLFEFLKFLHRNKDTSRLENVYFCENDQEAFTIIQRLIGSAEQGIFGDFKKIMLQNIKAIPGNDEDPFDEPEDENEREILRLSQLKGIVTTKFPFDVINLDFYGNFFPNEQGRYSDSFHTYIEILKLQKVNYEYPCKRFLMYLTVYTPMINEKRFINSEVITSFEQVLFENLVHEEFSKNIQEKYGTTDFKKFDVYLKFILGFTKQVIFKETYKQGWMPKIHNILTYDRTHSDGSPHKETTFVVEYYRNAKLDNLKDFEGAVFAEILEEYKAQLLDLVINRPEYVPKEADIPEEVRANLEAVREFRDSFLRDLGLYDPGNFS